MFNRKIKSIMAIFFILLTLQGCSVLRTKPLTTPEGVQLSKPLTKALDFLASFQTAYITLGNLTAIAYKSEVITKEQFDKIAVYAEDIRLIYVQQKQLVLAWYDAERKGILIDKTVLAEELVLALTQNFENLVSVIKAEVDLSPEDIQTINALVLILRTYSGVN
jgi:hypothetical protein